MTSRMDRYVPTTAAPAQQSLAGVVTVQRYEPREAGNISALKQPSGHSRQKIGFRQCVDFYNTMQQEKYSPSPRPSQEAPKQVQRKRLIFPRLRSKPKLRWPAEYDADKTNSHEQLSGTISDSPSVTYKLIDNHNHSRIVFSNLYDGHNGISCQPATCRGKIYGQKNTHEVYNHPLNPSTYQVNRPKDLTASTTPASTLGRNRITSKICNSGIQKDSLKQHSVAATNEHEEQVIPVMTSNPCFERTSNDTLHSRKAAPVLPWLPAQSPISLGFEDKRQSPARASKRSERQLMRFSRPESQRDLEPAVTNDSKLNGITRRAFRRSRSPNKKVEKKTVTGSNLQASPELDLNNCPGTVFCGSQTQPSNTAITESRSEDHPALRPTQAYSRELAKVTESMPQTGTHSKEPSIGSIISSYVGINPSDAFPINVSDAKPMPCASLTNGVPCKLSRPCPTHQVHLQSLPEAQDTPLPMTPRASSVSDRRHASPEHSPSKPIARSPARYRFIPADYSPPKQIQSSSVSNCMAGPAQPISKPAAVGRVKTAARPEAFPTPPVSPVRIKQGRVPEPSSQNSICTNLGSSNGSSLGNDTRPETTKDLKKRDLAGMRSQKAEILMATPEAPPVPHISTGDTQYEGIVMLPKVDLKDPGNIKWHESPASLANGLSSLGNSKNRGSDNLSQKSPVWVIAEQEPMSPIQNMSVANLQHAEVEMRNDVPNRRPGSTNSINSSTNILERLEVCGKTNGTVRQHRSIASRVPTPFFPDLLGAQSDRSSKRSSMIENEFEVIEPKIRKVVREEVQQDMMEPMIREVIREEVRNFLEDTSNRLWQNSQNTESHKSEPESSMNKVLNGQFDLDHMHDHSEHQSDQPKSKATDEKIIRLNGLDPRNRESDSRDPLLYGVRSVGAKARFWHRSTCSEP